MSHDHCVCTMVMASAGLLSVYLGARAAHHLFKLEEAANSLSSEKQGVARASDFHKEALSTIRRGGYFCTMVLGGAIVYALVREVVSKK